MNIVSYGGGTNSTALLVECVKRSIPVDLILFADTGGEKTATYKYVKIFSKWLVKNDMPVITRVQTNDINGTYITLEQKCLVGKRLPSIAYGFKSCSEKHKIRPQAKYINNWGPAKACWNAGARISKYLGFDADEPQRAKIDYSDKKYDYKYPLIDWDMGRDECIESIKSVGLELPGKSSCFFCPHMTKTEIRQLKVSEPALMDRALTIEANAELTKVKGLGRRFSWADLLASDAIDVTDTCQVDLPCECYDG